VGVNKTGVVATMDETFRIDILAGVVASDGSHVGRVDRVVIHPRTTKLTHIVIHKGVLLTKDKVVPVELVNRTDGGVVHLSMTPAELDRMPDFVEEEYVTVPQASPVGPYVPGSILWPTAYAYAPVIIKEERHVPENTIEITEGTDVFCADGKIGVVDEVLADVATGRVSGLVVRRGSFFTRDVTIPIGRVKRADSASVELTCTKEQLEDPDDKKRRVA
jgi:uncharacterized protein YrrD